MSYLYSSFAQLVSVHCKATAATSTLPVNQCKRSLLSYGYEQLRTFSNEQLDALDPYQRGASELIWSSIMREHPNSVLITTRKPLPTPPATSIIILTHQNPINVPTDNSDKAVSSETTSSSTNTAQYPKNPLFETETKNKPEFAMDMDIAYGYHAGQPAMNPAQVEIFDVKPAKIETFQQSQDNESKKETQTFLTGPHVVRVRPDGTPVDEDQYQPLPRDDDLEAFHTNTGFKRPSTPILHAIHAAAGRPTKHRKIATITSLKQKYLATLALKQPLLPPIEQPVPELQPPLERMPRQYPALTEFLSYQA